ncbi:hypothetical protein T484DRAFT_2780674 [Baffinella frigidus]|nr:hypothetical protein T484DRAFT_2780674 [Cryptophyta sp. CCMP2293]
MEVQMRWHLANVPMDITGVAGLVEYSAPVSYMPSNASYDFKTGRTRVAGCVSKSSTSVSLGAGDWTLTGLLLKKVETVVGSGVLVTCTSTRIGSLSVQDSPSGCDLVPRSNSVFDRCQVCNGENACVDCAGIAYGTTPVDVCGYCDGPRTSTLECTYCDNVIYPALAAWAAPEIDDCLVCGGGNNDKGCDGKCFSAKAKDVCGVCFGDGSACSEPALFDDAASLLRGGGAWALALAACVTCVVMRVVR